MQASLDLSTWSLGVALLGPALASVLAMPITGAVIESVSVRRVVRIGLVPFSLMVLVAPYAGGTLGLLLVLFAWGIGMGTVEVSMNAQAAGLQDGYGRRIMSSFHAWFSIGGLVGAGTGALAASAEVSVGWHLAVVGAAAVLAGQVVASWTTASHLDRGPEPGASAADRRTRPWPVGSTLIALAAIAFACLLCEGAALDWSAVYLHTTVDASLGYAGLGYAAFSLTMTGGRLLGDRLTHAVGPRRLVRASAAMASVGFAVALLVGSPAGGLVGFGLLGLGLSFVVPVVFSAAAGIGARGPSLAAVTTCGYLGFVAGPPLIGAVAGIVGLRWALGIVVAMTAVTALLAGRISSSPVLRG